MSNRRGHQSPRSLRIGQRSAIKAQHRAKLAVVYIRASTTEEQTAVARRALVERARTLGWPADRIKLREDIGCPGLADRQSDLEQLQMLLDAGVVGLVLTEDLSRIARDAVQLAKLLLSAKRAGAVIDVNGRFLDVNEKLLELNSGIYVSSILALRSRQEEATRIPTRPRLVAFLLRQIWRLFMWLMRYTHSEDGTGRSRPTARFVCRDRRV
jgi:hypothetical protein